VANCEEQSRKTRTYSGMYRLQAHQNPAKYAGLLFLLSHYVHCRSSIQGRLAQIFKNAGLVLFGQMAPEGDSLLEVEILISQ